MGRRCRLAALGLLALVLAAPTPGAAAERRVESVGSVPIRSGASRKPPKDQALAQAQRDAVYRVAGELLMETDLGQGGEPPNLEQILGRDVLSYTTRFRILEDRGVRPALFSEDPSATSEYVVVVEVRVDEDRVRSRLVDAGLLAPQEGALGLRTLELEVEGLEAYGAYRDLRELLLTGAGAREVVPLEVGRGQMLLRVRGDSDAGAFRDKLLSSAPPGLAIDPLPGGSPGRLRIAVRWSPPPEAEGDGAGRAAARSPRRGAGAIDTQGRNRY